MKDRDFKHAPPKFYGSTTVGERGQVVIPAEARRDFKIMPTTKLLVFGHQRHGGLVLTRAETVSEFIEMANDMIEKLEELRKSLKAEDKLHGSSN